MLDMRVCQYVCAAHPFFVFVDWLVLQPTYALVVAVAAQVSMIKCHAKSKFHVKTFVQAQFSMLKRMCDVKFSMLYGHFTGILRV
jgi:hypothetical protein